MTYTGVSIAETFNREPPSKRKEELDGQHREPKPHEMGLQVPRCVYPKVPQEDAVWAVACASGGGVSRVSAAKGESDIRNYIRNQEKEDEKLDQLGLWK